MESDLISELAYETGLAGFCKRLLHKYPESTGREDRLYRADILGCNIFPAGQDKKTVGTIYEITERTIDKHGQFLLVPDIELNTLWTNLPLPDETAIDLYHAHGECEQYHSEIKTDMDVKRLPSGKFETNRLVLELTIIAYNILRIIGQELLKKRDDPSRKKVR